MKFLPCPAFSSRFSFLPQRLSLITTSGVESSRILASVLTTFGNLVSGSHRWRTVLNLTMSIWLSIFYLLSLYVWSSKAWYYRSFLKDVPQPSDPSMSPVPNLGSGHQRRASLRLRQDPLKSVCCLQHQWCYKISTPNISRSLSRKATSESSFCN